MALRGELTLLRTARALAAFEGASQVEDSHLKRIAVSALRHRLRRNPLDESGSEYSRRTRDERGVCLIDPRWQRMHWAPPHCSR
jgi:magnesium chelatase subunit I